MLYNSSFDKLMWIIENVLNIRTINYRYRSTHQYENITIYKIYIIYEAKVKKSLKIDILLKNKAF